MDEGKYYIKKTFYFEPTLLFEEIKEKQLNYAFKMIELFIERYSKKKNLKSFNQKGKVSYFPRIPSSFSELNINKSIKSQINKIRTRDNKNFPSYFIYKRNIQLK